MTTGLLAARLVIGGLVMGWLMAGPALAQGVEFDHSAGAFSVPPANTVVVSCFRGPWRETIWDRPEPVFVDSLRSVGYDYATAESIADRVCKDVSLVGNPEGLRSEVERIVAESPNFRQF